ncbi:MAG: signal peptidase II [Methylophilaceae bacterium]
MKRIQPWLFISVVVIALDQTTKLWMQSVLAYGEHMTVTSFFDLLLVHNSGAAFSFLADAGGWQRILFSAFALIASIVIIQLLRKTPEKTLFCFALSLIMGGALGNLWDRLTMGFVVDFLYFHYAGYGFPAFNVADSAITGGVMLLLWDGFNEKRETNNER